MEKIIGLSFERFKKSFLRYFLVYVLSILGTIGVALGTVIIGGILFLIFMALGRPVIPGIIVGTVAAIALFIGLLYISAWIQLAQVLSVVGTDIKEVFDCFKKAKPMVWSFLGFGILSALFFFGLFYTNILLFIPMIVWMIWGSFSAFAFIDGKRGGLTPLWYSRAKVQGHFWKVFLYILVAYAALFVLSSLTVKIDESLAVVNGIVWFLASPFLLAYFYEIYHSLPKPTEVKRPTGWVILSIIGWVLGVALMVFGIISLVSSGSKTWKKSWPTVYRNGVQSVTGATL